MRFDLTLAGFVFVLGIDSLNGQAPAHIDVRNPHSFEIEDLKKLITKVIFTVLKSPSFYCDIYYAVAYHHAMYM